MRVKIPRSNRAGRGVPSDPLRDNMRGVTFGIDAQFTDDKVLAGSPAERCLERDRVAFLDPFSDDPIESLHGPLVALGGDRLCGFGRAG